MRPGKPSQHKSQRRDAARDTHAGKENVPSQEWVYESKSVTDTLRLGQAIGRQVRGGDVVALYGDLGTGKTTFVRGMATGVGAKPRAVTSPTFVLIHEYRGRLLLAHADLYRLESLNDIRHLGMEDYFNEHTAVAVEWADRGSIHLPPDRLDVRLSHAHRDARSIRMQAGGPLSRRLLAAATVLFLGA
ncbi:MAG TPA: tRNA (adenosine(37)-N6)-threonylcarbamoyltransferase complex ATPase subunit type 1 TsaE [Nitrospiraceae bacterium]|nr:tRNA (adenosine(37)-N6)-threonylcarbamoyltransferase complex ATPase subunit type 1 TsaE [Nitrospiraceae bacterium]